MELARTAVVPDQVGTDIIAIPAGSSVDLVLRLESVVEGVLVSGSAHGTASGACVRCLDPVSLPVQARFQELFTYSDRADHHRKVAGKDAGADEADVFELAEDLFDLEPVLRDAVVPTLPFQPVCRADCPGLCSECGAHLADDPTHRHDVTDPRWAVLQGFSTPAPTDLTQERRT